jgi:HPt (histidine-containing phosphotransfer) domain-containing protein
VADARFDDHALALLRQALGADAVARLVALYLDRVPVRIAALRAASAGGDLDEASRHAHSLGSAARQFGAAAVGALADASEAAAHAGDRTGLAVLAERIAAEHAVHRAWLDARAPEVGGMADPDGA